MSRAATQGRSSISSVVEMVALASITVSALGSDLRQFGRADDVERFGRQHPFALEKAEEALQRRQHPRQRARAQALAAPLRHEGANIGAAQVLERLRLTAPPVCPARN